MKLFPTEPATEKIRDYTLASQTYDRNSTFPNMALPTPQELAATYETPRYEDAWNCVRDYHTVIEYAAAHPQQGSTAIASQFNLPRGRIRPWLNNSQPDVVRGIQAAESRGWLAGHTTPEQEQALVELAAWALSGGSIHLDAEAYAYFAIEPHSRDEFDRIATTAKLSYRVIRENDPARATEARATTDGSVLARVFAAMGLPTQGKSRDNPAHLPAFVDRLDAPTRERFASIYVLNRASEHDGKDTLTIREERPETYLNELVALLRDVSNQPVTRSGYSITLSAAAAEILQRDTQSEPVNA